MSRIVCYIPSYNDSERAAESLASCPDWEVVISDNCSDEPHARALAALASERVRVVRQEKPLGRVGNWRFCVEHFVDSGATWMKFLSAGDRHKPDALDIYRRAMQQYPSARFIVGQIDMVWPTRSAVWRMFDDDSRITPAAAMELVALHGNIFHSLIAPLIHVDVVRDGFAFGEGILSYCADLLFLVEIARKTDTYYVSKVVAQWILAHRKTFTTTVGTLTEYLEEATTRLRAAEHALRLTGDREKYTQLIGKIVDVLRTGLAYSPARLAGDEPGPLEYDM